MKTSTFSIIDADARGDTDLVCLATNGSENRVYRFDGDAWAVVASWTVAEAASCCLVGGSLICGSFYGPIVAVDLVAGRVRALRQSDDIGNAMAAAAWRDEIGLIGGERGRFAVVRPESGEVSVRRLSSYGLPRPGRGIYEFVAAVRGIYFLGARGLLFRYRPQCDECDDILGSALGRREISFRGGLTEDEGDLWVSCAEGAKQLLMRLSGSTVSEMDSPLQGMSTPALCRFDGQLCIASDEILLGDGQTWESRWRVPTGSDDAVIRLLPTREYGLCAVTARGTAVFLNGNRATEVPIL